MTGRHAPSSTYRAAHALPLGNLLTSPAVLKARAGNGWRLGALVVGVLAVTLLVVVGCSKTTGGEPVVDAAGAPEFRTSMSVSASMSAVTSSQQESDRQETQTIEAVHSSCDTLSVTSVDAVTAINAYVGAVSSVDKAEVGAKEVAATDALNRGADTVAGSLRPALPPPLRDGLMAWVDSARAVAKAIAEHLGQLEFNAAVDTFNAANSTALSLCDGAY